MELFRELSFKKARIPTTLKDYFIASTTPGQQPITASFTKTKENKIMLSDEYNGKLGFTGTFVGLCVQDLAGTRKHADFDYFRYSAL